MNSFQKVWIVSWIRNNIFSDIIAKSFVTNSNMKLPRKLCTYTHISKLVSSIAFGLSPSANSHKSIILLEKCHRLPFTTLSTSIPWKNWKRKALFLRFFMTIPLIGLHTLAIVYWNAAKLICLSVNNLLTKQNFQPTSPPSFVFELPTTFNLVSSFCSRSCSIIYAIMAVVSASFTIIVQRETREKRREKENK